MKGQLPEGDFCPLCVEAFQRSGVVGICDHPFPGRPARLWWANMRPPVPGRPVGEALCNVGIARAATLAEATAILQPPARHPVMPLDDPAFLSLAATLEVGQALLLEDTQLPKAWTHRRNDPYGR